MQNASIFRVQAMAMVLYPGEMSKEIHDLLVSVLEGGVINYPLRFWIVAVIG